MKDVIIYTDGACSGNPGPGGWGAVLLYGPHRKELSGYVPETTNQRMELLAAASALSCLKEPCRVRLHSDSAYLVRAFHDGWLTRWQQNGWKNSKKQDVENRDLWEQLLALCRQHEVSWIKVAGHSDVTENERCDALARAAIVEARKSDS